MHKYGNINVCRKTGTRTIFLLLFVLTSLFTRAQKNTATLSGRVVDENDRPLAKVTVAILGRQSGMITSDSGTFTMKTPAGIAFAIVFSYSGYD